MRKRLKIMKNSAKKSRRLVAITIVLAATAILATGAVTVVSRQTAQKESTKQREASSMTNGANRNYTPGKVAEQEVQVDGPTGQMKELSPEEARKLAAGLRQEINKSTEGLVPVQRPDGSQTMDLEGRFQNVTVARINEDGSVSTSCVDNAQSAGEFFGIDPQLIENGTAGNKTGTQKPRAMRSNNQDK